MTDKVNQEDGDWMMNTVKSIKLINDGQMIDWCLKPTSAVFQTIEWWIQINQRTLINDGQMTIKWYTQVQVNQEIVKKMKLKSYIWVKII